MPRARTLELDLVRKLLAGGASGAEIARRTGASPATVSRAIAKLKEEPPPTAAEVRRRLDVDDQLRDDETDDYLEKAEEAERDEDEGDWDPVKTARLNLAKALKIRDDRFTPAKDRRQVLRDVRQCNRDLQEMTERNYGVRQMQAFIDEVLAILDEIEPGSRDRVIERLKEKGSLPCVTGSN